MRPIDVIRDMSGKVYGRMGYRGRLEAVQKFGATGHPDNYWWGELEVDSRLEYFDWLIKQYKDK